MKSFREWLLEQKDPLVVSQNMPNPPGGVRDMRSDLSTDYPDFVSRFGTIGTFKILKTNGKFAKPRSRS